jgi:uncharacterized protein involved in exopolysaccharide biosynthesis
MERTYTLDDVLGVLRRRRALALVVGVATLAVGLAVTWLAPNEYTAQSTVQIEARRLAMDFMPAQAVIPFEDRMRTVKHGILARPVLERVVKETDFFPDLREDVDRAVEKLRRQVEVRLEGEVPAGAPALLFVVEVRGRDPEKVRAAAELLPRYYEALTREVLQTQARSLRETLDGQVAAMARQLQEGEQKVLAFKRAHAAELPEMVDTNARAASRAEALLEMHLAATLDANRRKAALLGALPEPPSVPGMAEAGLDVATRRVESAEAAYSSDHPDVKRARRELQEAISRRDTELEGYRGSRLKEALARIDEEVREHRATVASLRRELATYQARVEAAPRWGQELASLTRDYDAVRAKYVATVAHRADAAAAEQLLAADARGLFRTVEPAAKPMAPSAPDRLKLAALALLVALAAASLAAGLAEWMDRSLRGPEDAAGHGVPVLASVPRIGPRRTA